MTRTCMSAAIVVVLAAGSGRGASGAPGAGGATSHAATVIVTSVRLERLERVLALPGELSAFQSVGLYPRVQAFVEWVEVDRGAAVRKGDVLVRLHAPELLAQRAEAAARAQGVRAQWQEAQAKLAADQATYRRLKAASAVRGTVAGNEVEIALHAMEASRERARAWEQSQAAAEQALRAVTEMEAYLRVTAPFHGVVTERNVHPGSLSGPAATLPPLLKLQEVSRLRLVIGVPEPDVGGVRPGISATFRVPAWPAISFSTRVTRTARALDPRSRTMPDPGAGTVVKGGHVCGARRRATRSFCRPSWVTSIETGSPTLSPV